MKRTKHTKNGETFKWISAFMGMAILLAPLAAMAQSISEKIIREAPRLSWSAGVTYDSNLQEQTAYDSSQGMALRLTPRYRLSDKLTILASSGVTQRFTQEERSDFLNSSISLSRNPFALGKVGDMRVTSSIILPSNEVTREKESLLSAFRLGSSFFVRTNTNFIWEVGAFGTVNSHRYSVSAFDSPNIQTRLSPYNNIGWTFKDR